MRAQRWRRTLVWIAVSTMVATCFGAVRVEAAPAYPVVTTFEQPDGTQVSLRLWGDEYAHGRETLDGFTVLKNPATGVWEYAQRSPSGQLTTSGIRVGGGTPPVPGHLRPTRAAINAARAARSAPASGIPTPTAAPPWAGADTDVLFILVGFSDVPCSFTGAAMQANLFGGAASGPGDLDDYFSEISYGALQLDGVVAGCFTLSNTKAHYNTGPGSAASLIAEAVALADPTTNFATYDNDGNGVVDVLGIIYAGGGPHDGCYPDNPPGGFGGDSLWPHSSGTGGTPTADGVSVNPYIIQSEVTFGVNPPTGCTQIQTIGLFAHEMGHALGLPDLYDTDFTSDGVGSWSCMANQYLSAVNLSDSPPHYDPWSKWFEGWVTPVDYTGMSLSGASIPRAEDSPFVVRLLANPGGPQVGGTGEYFLVENRQQALFDAQLPGCGLVVWHIEESQFSNNSEGHAAGSHRLVDVEEADGLEQLDDVGDRGDAGDPYPGTAFNAEFTDATDPTANLYSGAASGVKISQIGACAASMTASFGPVPGDCCEDNTGEPAGCNDSTCEACVCGMNASCCGSQWNQTCADLAADECLASCQQCAPLDHFTCYKAAATKGSVKFPGIPNPPGVTLLDQFPPQTTVAVKKPTRLCNPTQKTAEPPPANPTEHLKAYQVKPAQKFAKVLDQAFTDQFGVHHVDVMKAAELMLPTAKDLLAPPPPLASPVTDHFQCYKIKDLKIPAKFQPVNVSLLDQFGSLQVQVKKLTRLCAPVNKNNEEPGVPTHSKHLLCYQVKDLKIPAKFQPVQSIFVNNQFGAETLDAKTPAELCVPAVEIP